MAASMLSLALAPLTQAQENVKDEVKNITSSETTGKNSILEFQSLQKEYDSVRDEENKELASKIAPSRTVLLNRLRKYSDVKIKLDRIIPLFQEELLLKNAAQELRSLIQMKINYIIRSIGWSGLSEGSENDIIQRNDHKLTKWKWENNEEWNVQEFIKKQREEFERLQKLAEEEKRKLKISDSEWTETKKNIW